MSTKKFRPISQSEMKKEVCFFWKSRSCSRYRCPFLHVQLPLDSTHPLPFSKNRSCGTPRSRSMVWRNPNPVPKRNPDTDQGVPHPCKTIDKVCKSWIAGKCDHGDRCEFVHSWFMGDSFTFITTLEGHEKAVSGITLPLGSSKLISSSKDNSLRVWDCHSGKCDGVINLMTEIDCIISEGSWVFVGIPNAIKVWNLENDIDVTLAGPIGRVYALDFCDETLFAGTEDGSILSWNFNPMANCFEKAASLSGHTLSVLTLISGAGRLYSGSMDHTIKVWDLGTSQCMLTLTDHTSAITSVLCWDQYLLSCSLDKTVKVWVATETGSLEVCYTHNVEHGLRMLRGMLDDEAKPVLFCSCNDNSIRLYDLPSFGERGRIFSKEEVLAIQIGPGGLFFTGDGTGEVKVWKMLTKESVTA